MRLLNAAPSFLLDPTSICSLRAFNRQQREAGADFSSFLPPLEDDDESQLSNKPAAAGPLFADDIPAAAGPSFADNVPLHDFELSKDLELPPVDLSIVEEVLREWELFEAALAEDGGLEEEDEGIEKEYEQRDGGFDYDREDEYHLNMGDMSDELEAQMEKMVAEFTSELRESNMDLLRAYNLKLEDNLTDATYAHLSRAFPKHQIASLKATRKRVEYLAQFQPQPYDCCINTCVYYTSPNEALDKCRFCGEPRYNSSGKPRKRFNYIPLTPRLAALYQDREMVKQMSYHHNYKPQADPIEDLYNGKIYQLLCETKVTVGKTEQDHKFFEQETDIALGLSSDGFAPFKS
ncbi:hypothetical protein EST38_g11658 [Candolleomyces aberdarensis]|uniref:Uncharacterized protein n=1 Tax=Candolleomyces aberdarensis TaxID=2316362 RepID=A0A4Q2D7M5_9AGAR|nr:hypothetical protein EST38_g11658 [Candolleomyces aberdarensis]